MLKPAVIKTSYLRSETDLFAATNGGSIDRNLESNLNPAFVYPGILNLRAKSNTRVLHSIC